MTGLFYLKLMEYLDNYSLQPDCLSLMPIAYIALVAGQNPVKPIWNKLAPTKNVSHNQLISARLT